MDVHLLSMVTLPMRLQHEGIVQGTKKGVLSSHHVACTPPAAAVRDGELLSTNLAPMADPLHLSLLLFCLKQPLSKATRNTTLVAKTAKKDSL